MSSDSVDERLLQLENRIYALETVLASEASPASRSFEAGVVDLFRKGIGTPMFEKYVSYGLQSLQRGEKLVGTYADVVRTARRYLDVGSAYGGAVIAMVESGVSSAVGIDIDERLVSLAAVHAAQRGVGERTRFATGDIVDPEAIAELGRFDLITCIDVLEHVLKPETALDHLSRLTAPGGTVIVDVPNPRSYQWIERDPHHELFGSIMLDREDAIRVFSERFPGNQRYTVGYFFPLEWYVSRLESRGFSVEITDPVCEEDWGQTVQRTRGLPRMLDEVSRKQNWSAWHCDLIREKLSSHLLAFERECAADDSWERLQCRFGVPVYHLKCVKRRGFLPAQAYWMRGWRRLLAAMRGRR